MLKMRGYKSKRGPIDINSLFINNVNAAMSFPEKRAKQAISKVLPSLPIYSPWATSLDLSFVGLLVSVWGGGFWSTSSSFLCQMINWMKFNIHNWIGICSRSTRAFRIRLTLARSILKTIVVVYSCWSLLLLLLLSCLWLTEGAGRAKGFQARDFIFNRQTSGGNVCPKKSNFY